jgi:pimeloyl-ACP methyl ester carboxylesterase/DNA-binding CsgD family transcriptional regulator
MEPAVEYATTIDGRRIATFAIGEGHPLLVAATPPWSHVQQEFQIPAVRAWLTELAQHVRVIRYDCRGTGLSDREPIDFSVDAQVRDIEAIVDHHALGPFAIWASIGGSPPSIAYTARHPERVTHLLCWGAYARGDWFIRKVPGWDNVAALVTENWTLFTDVYAHGAFGWPESDTAERYAQLTRDAITQQALLELMRQLPLTDVTEDARAVRTPTLVLARRNAEYIGVEEARTLAALIPGSRLMILEGSSGAPFLENPGSVSTAILDFIASSAEVRPPRRPAASLTQREQEVLRLLANGHTGKEIAGQLRISVPTAQRHIANIYAKIGARGRVDAAAYAFEHGMLPRRTE